MEWFINMGLTFAPICASWLVFCGLVYTTCHSFIYKKRLKPLFIKCMIGVSVVMFLFFATQPAITYKHTTDYNKQQDVYNIERQQESVSSVADIVDKTLKPKTTDESRKQSFEEAVKYN